jgi:hypothetical protein
MNDGVKGKGAGWGTTRRRFRDLTLCSLEPGPAQEFAEFSVFFAEDKSVLGFVKVYK